jgi:hypothetical protein
MEALSCGIALFDDRAYQLPMAGIDPHTRQPVAPPNAVSG